MTNEQRKAIDKLTNGENIDFATLIRTFKKEGIENFAVVRKEYLDTVLSLIKEKDKIINEQLKENVKLQKELNEENKRCMILANNDKFKEQVIDLIVEELWGEFYLTYMNGYGINSKEELKQYFAGLGEKE